MTYQDWLGFMQQYLQSVEKYSSIYSGQQIDTAVGKALNPDTTPTASSSALITSGAVKSAIDNVACRPNLLDNWYFVGGGSQQGGGQFPINQRGQTSYTGTGYKIDRWVELAGGTLEITAAGVNFGKVISSYNYNLTRQTIEADMSAYVGMNFTVSFLTPTGFYTKTGALSTSHVYADDGANYIRFSYDTPTKRIGVDIVSVSSFTVLAVKLELGDTQTLAHQENGVWVLNELPNYQQELAKCQRYFYKTGASFKIRIAQYDGTGKHVWFGLPLPVVMRTTPTASLGIIDLYTPTASSGQRAASISVVDGASASGIDIQATFPSDTYDGFVIVSGLSISADL